MNRRYSLKSDRILMTPPNTTPMETKEDLDEKENSVLELEDLAEDKEKDGPAKIALRLKNAF